MAKISGIKGINISKASVLGDGSKKSSTNDSFRDTANGTTRDNSGNSALDAAMIKMLLGQTELMAKRTEQIEANMKRAQQRDEERQRRLEESIKEKEKTEETREAEKARREDEKRENKFNKAIDSLDKGIVNGMLSGFLGPAGVFLGKGLNAMGLPVDKLIKKGLYKTTRLLSNVTNSAVGWLARKADGESGEEGDAASAGGQSAVSVNRKEESARPINEFKHTVTGYMKKIIKLMGGKGKESEDKKTDWFKRILGSVLPFLLGYITNYEPLKEFGTKFFVKMLRKPLDFLFKQLVKLVSIALNPIGSMLAKGLSKVWDLFKGGSKTAVEQAAKTASKKAATTATKETAKKAAAKTAEQAAKTLSKKGGAKAGEEAAKVIGKKIPGLGFILGGAFAAQRAFKGDWTGAGLELLSGAASTVPVFGTAASIGIDAALLGRDIYKDVKSAGSENIPISEGSYSTTQAVQNSRLEEEQATSREILETLRQIEYNLNPEIQRELDTQYVTNIKREFEKAPEYSSNLFNEYPSLNNSWSEQFKENMRQ